MIADDTAITAGHCVGTGMKVRFGNENNPQARVATVTGYEHPTEFNQAICESAEPGKDESDIAVVHFGGGLPAGFHPATVYDGQIPLGNGDSITLAGYGVTNATSGAGSGVLRKTQVVVGDINYAATEIKFDSSHGTSDCFGDSGGPAFVMNGAVPLLYGSDSWGDSACREFSIYTKVPSHMTWVTAAAARLRAAHPAPGTAPHGHH